MMAEAADAWFWFPEYRTGLVYRDGGVDEGSHMLRIDESSGDRLIVQFPQSGARLLCFDIPGTPGNERFGFADGEGQAKKFTELLTPGPGARVGILATAPEGWDVVTASWLTTSSDRPLRVRHFLRDSVSDPKFITAADLQTPLSELTDVTLSFGSGDLVGPAFTPVLLAEEPQVLVTFPEHPSETNLVLQVHLMGGSGAPVPVGFLLRDPHNRRKITAVGDLVVRAQSRGESFPLSASDILVRLEIYVQVPEGVRLSCRDGNGPRIEVEGGLTARRLEVGKFSPVELERLDNASLQILADNQKRLARSGRRRPRRPPDTVGDTTDGEADLIRHELARKRGLGELLEHQNAAVPLDRIPAPLFVSLLDHAGRKATQLEAALQFLRWPAASQLQQTIGYGFDPVEARTDIDDAVSLIWRRAGVIGDAVRWLAGDPKRQIRILPHISPAIDVVRLIASVRKVRDLKDDDFDAVVRDLIEIADQDWPELFSSMFEGGAMQRRGQRLLAKCANPPDSVIEIRKHCNELRQYEDDVRAHLGKLVDSRRLFAAYSQGIAAAVDEFGRSRREGLAIIKRLTEKYVLANEGSEVDIGDLVAQIEGCVAAEFRFDRNAILGIARQLADSRKRQAEFIQWTEQLVQLLCCEIDVSEMPAWPERPSIGDLAGRAERVRQALTPFVVGDATSEIARLGAPLQADAERLRAALANARKRANQSVAAMRTDDLGLAVMLDQVDRAADSIVLQCICSKVDMRRRLLLERHDRIAGLVSSQLSDLVDLASRDSGRLSSAASLDERSGFLDRIEYELANVERSIASLDLTQLYPALRKCIERPRSADFKLQAAAQVAIWQAETDDAAARIARAAACCEALGGQVRSGSVHAAAAAPSDTGAAIDLLLAWSGYRAQQMSARDEVQATLAETVGATLKRECPTMPWNHSAAERLANALASPSDDDPFETAKALASALHALNTVWQLTGGDDAGHVRDVLWLARGEPVVRDSEILLAAAESIERLVNDRGLRSVLANLDGLNHETRRQGLARDFPSFRKFIGDLAHNRLVGLAENSEPDVIRALKAVPGDMLRVRNFSSAIDSVRKLTDLARQTGNAGAERDRALLREILRRHKLLPGD